jgi:hypothetical protein
MPIGTINASQFAAYNNSITVRAEGLIAQMVVKGYVEANTPEGSVPENHIGPTTNVDMKV